MKLLIKTYNSNEYWDCDHLLLSLTPEQIANLYAHRDKCVAAIKALDPTGWGGNIGLPLKGLDAQFGNYSFENIPDGHYQRDLDEQEWTLLADDAVFLDNEYERTECEMVKVTRDGGLWITALAHYCEGKVECRLWPEALESLCSQPQPA